MKKLERVVHVRTYLEKVVLARKTPFPFELLHDSEILEDWGKALTPFFMKEPYKNERKFGIQQFCRLKYDNEFLYASKTYLTDKWFQFSYWKPDVYKKKMFRDITLEEIRKPGVSLQKMRDIRDLYDYLSGDETMYFERMYMIEGEDDASDTDDDF